MYIKLLIMLLLYKLYKLENKNYLIIVLFALYYLYINNIIPEFVLEIPKRKLSKTDLRLIKIDKLVNRYNESNNEFEYIKLKKIIDEEIKKLYFIFPKYEHEKIDDYLYNNYGF